jgi:threonine/homoserine/homoserine lactone efflux protein
MVLYLILGIGYGFAAAVQPGPFTTYLISRALSSGWRRTLPAALAPLISDGPIIAVTLFVLSQMPGWLERILNCVGGLFVLYLAYNAFRNWQASTADRPLAQPSVRQGIIKAAIVNVLSPVTYLYWTLVTGPLLLAGWREDPATGAGFLVGFYAALVASLGLIIFGFGSAKRLGSKMNRALLGLSIIALACFGLYRLWLALRGAV